MEKGKLSIHSENILPIIKKWLYSDRDIFLRELISNACDAINKLKFIQSKDVAHIKESDFRIDIKIDKEKKTMTISDNGIGMSAEEVKKYIAQIAFSGAEEFLKKYQSNEEKDQFIGHFGLGFYSSYMVSDLVEIKTKSYEKKNPAVLWSCDGSSEYSIEEISKDSIGTDIILHINEDGLEFLEENKIKQILQKYCPYIPFAIYLNDTNINNKNPLWIKNPSDLTKKDYLDFYRDLYPLEPDPIFWVHINVDYPFHVKGILYFPKFHQNFDVQKSSIKLFCNRVFVSDNCKDLLPDYLTILRGALDSPDIPLNVSRSYLQMNKTVKQLSSHIAKKLSDRLTTLYQTDRDKFIASWSDIEMVIKLGVLQDEKFYERAKQYIIFPNTKKEWLTIEEYLERNKEKTDNKIYYTQQDKTSASLLKIFEEKNIEVLKVNNYIDTALINYLEAKVQTKFQRVDGAIDDTLLDPSKEKTLLNNEGRSEAAVIAQFIKNALSIDELEVEAKSLASKTLPAFLMIKEEERRLRDYMNLSNRDAMPLPIKKTLVVNTNNKLIQQAQKMHFKDPKTSQALVRTIYDLTLLSHKELESEDLSEMIHRTTHVLEQLAANNAKSN